MTKYPPQRQKMAWDTCICAVITVLITVSLTPANAAFIGDEGNYYRGSDGSNETWGHEVAQRNQTIIQSNARTWLDKNVVLPSGRLTGFSIYTHEYPGVDDVAIHLQIWRQVTGNRFELILDQREIIENKNGAVKYSITGSTYLPAGTYMGITVEADFTPISFDYVERYPTQFRLVPSDSYPEVGQVYTFQALPYPSVFSMACTIDAGSLVPDGGQGDTGPPGPTGAKGDQGDQGEQGPSGPPGADGIDGADGAVGPPGPTGAMGPQGPPGVGGGGGEDNEDECDTGNNECSGNSQCVNTVGSYICQCPAGYELNQNGRTCQDTVECDTNNGGCEQSCDNADGTFTCSCDVGYVLGQDARSCEDVNECLQYTPSQCSMVCINTPGSYMCLKLHEVFSVSSGLQGDAAKNVVTATLTSSTGAVVWLVALTAIIFVVMAVSFRRWRVDYCARRYGASDTDLKSDTSSTVSHNEMEERYGGTQYANDGLEAEDGSVSRVDDTPATLKVQTAC